MKRLAFSILFGSVFTIGFCQKDTSDDLKSWVNKKCLEGQTAEDSIIRLKYLNDTTGFIKLPAQPVLDSVIPDRYISSWELDWSMQGQYEVLFRSSRDTSLRNTKKVLATATSGFGTVCPPSYCFWYIAAALKSGGIITVNNGRKLSAFLGQIDNVYDAYLWLTLFFDFDSGGIPLEFSEGTKYKPINDGYLIRTTVRVSDCTVTDAELLYFIRKDRNVTFLQVLDIIVEGGCI